MAKARKFVLPIWAWIPLAVIALFFLVNGVAVGWVVRRGVVASRNPA